jgi:hypothetical protein
MKRLLSIGVVSLFIGMTAHVWWPHHLRAGGPDSMAQPSVESNFDRYGWQGLGSAMGRSSRGNSAR